MNEIKPCPICGSKARLNRYNTYIASFTRSYKFYVSCTKNFNHVRDADDWPLGFFDKSEAIQYWNENV